MTRTPRIDVAPEQRRGLASASAGACLASAIAVATAVYAAPARPAEPPPAGAAAVEPGRYDLPPGNVLDLTLPARPAPEAPVAPAQASAGDVPMLNLSELSGRNLMLIDAGTPTERSSPRFDRADLAETMRRALGNSSDLASLMARADSQRWLVDVAKGAYRPQLNARGAIGGEISRPGAEIDPVTNAAVTESQHGRTDTSVVFRQPIVDLPANAEIRRYQSLSRSADANAQQAREQAALEAAKAHLDLLQNLLALEFAKDYRDDLMNLYSFIRRRVAAGGASPSEADRIKARAINAHSTVIEAIGLLESSMISYRRQIGAVPATILAEDVLLPNALPSLEEAIRIARRDNPNVVSLREQLRATEHEAAVAAGQFSPTFAFEAGNYRTRNAGGKPGWSNDTRAMLVVSMNLLNGGADLAQRRSVLARADDYRFRILDAERKIEEAVAVLANTISAVTKRIAASREEYLANQRVVTAFDDQLRQANRPLLDVLDAQQRLYTSRVELLRVTMLAASLTLEMQRQLGRLVDADLAGSAPRMALPAAAGAVGANGPGTTGAAGSAGARR